MENLRKLQESDPVKESNIKMDKARLNPCQRVEPWSIC